MDKVGDLLIRIKNGYLASRNEVSAPHSKLALAICQLLEKEGYIQDCQVKDREIKVTLKYESSGTTLKRQPVLTDVKRISKPGRRVYQGNKSLPWVYDGLGMAIISTPKGIMSDKQARKEGVGGEIMAFVW